MPLLTIASVYFQGEVAVSFSILVKSLSFLRDKCTIPPILASGPAMAHQKRLATQTREPCSAHQSQLFRHPSPLLAIMISLVPIRASPCRFDYSTITMCVRALGVLIALPKTGVPEASRALNKYCATRFVICNLANQLR